MPIAMTEDKKPAEEQQQGHAYFIDASKVYEPLTPSTSSNLIALYDLDAIAASVARSNADGSKGVKLRKSYKNHIADLPGKHIIPKERNLSFVAFQPRENVPPVELKPLDEEYLYKCLNFDKTHGPIPGFDTVNLAMLEDEGGSSNKRRAGSDDSGSARKRNRPN